jgi:hypothetical protein
VRLTTHHDLMPKTKNEWSYTCTPPIRLHGVVLSLKKKAQGQLYFTFHFSGRYSYNHLTITDSESLYLLTYLLKHYKLGYTNQYNDWLRAGRLGFDSH